MDVKEKAKTFAIAAHKGQVRKSEIEKPMIIHPLKVGYLLEKYGYDDNVVAAGYLHDTIEDSPCSIKMLEKEFGIDVAFLVFCASEPDKSLSWEERKKHTIEDVKNLPLRYKAVVCCDKISNLEDMDSLFKRNEKKDFSHFKKGYTEQKWYFTSLYNSLIEGENESNEMFVRLKEAIDNVFYKKDNIYLKNKIFDDNLEDYSKLKVLHAKKQELYEIKSVIEKKPFVIELSGTPRTGKTSLINNLADFFDKGGFDVSVLPEFVGSSHYKTKILPSITSYNLYTRNLIIANNMLKELENELEKSPDILLIDRSIFDRIVWMKNLLKNHGANTYQYNEFVKYYYKKMCEKIDAILVLHASSIIALKRDYNNSLALENRRFLNDSNLNDYNYCLGKVYNQLKSDKMIWIDTDNRSKKDISYESSDKVLSLMRKEYLNRLNSKY